MLPGVSGGTGKSARWSVTVDGYFCESDGKSVAFTASKHTTLMLQKSHSQPPFGCTKSLGNNGINLPTSTGAGFLNHQHYNLFADLVFV